MLSAILLTFIKLPFSIKTFVLSISKWPLKTCFTVLSSVVGNIFMPPAIKKTPGPIAQLVFSHFVDPGVMSLIQPLPHTLVEIDHEIYSRVILLLPLIQERMLSVTCESICAEYWLTTV